MPRMSEMFPSKYLSAKDLDGEKKTFTIVDVRQETIEGRDGEEDQLKWTLDLEDNKPLVLNVTNAKSISSIYGDDTDDWLDQKVVLYPTKVLFKGQNTDAIRVHEDATKALLRQALAKAKNGKPARTKPDPAIVEAKPDEVEDVPF